MALSVKVGSITPPATNISQAYTGVGFQPKAILFWGSFTATADAVQQGANPFFGCATSATQEWCVAAEDEDNQATSDNASCVYDDRSIGALTANGAVGLRADFTSFDSDGFTMNWTTGGGTNAIINYMALGGGSITNAKAGTFTLASSGTPQAFTDPGFQADLLVFGYVGDSGSSAVANTINTVSDNYGIGIGAATSTTARAAAHSSAQDNAGTMNANREHIENGVTVGAQFNLNATQEWEADLASIDATGFTLSVSDLPIAARIHGYLAIKGGRYNVIGETQQTSNTTKATTGAGFQPAGAMFFGVASTGADPAVAHAALMIGASDGTNHKSAINTTEDNTASSEAATYVASAKAISHINPSTEAVNGLASVNSFDSDGYTLSWASTDGAAYKFTSIVLGSDTNVVETGAGIAGLVGSGAAASLFAETGVGIAGLTGAGVKAFSTGGGNIYTKASFGIVGMVASGSSASVFAETGGGTGGGAGIGGGGSSGTDVQTEGVSIAFGEGFFDPNPTWTRIG